MDRIIEFLSSYAEWVSVAIGFLALILTAVPLIKKSIDERKSRKTKEAYVDDRFTVTITDNRSAGKNKISVNMSEANIKEIRNVAGRDISISNPIQTILNPPDQPIGPDANLEGAILSRTELEGENLRRANLRKAVLTESNLSYANLVGANLEEATLESTNLYKANLRQTNLKGANLHNANLEGANLEGATYDKSTQWPNLFNPVELGAILEP